jgi:hypothetical protein
VSDEVSQALGIAQQTETKSVPADVLAQLLAESKKQTRHLRAIRWMLALAWLVVVLGGIRLAIR